MRRRSWLRAAGSLALFGLAGCSSGGGGTTATDTPTGTTPTATATPTESTADHLDEADAEFDAALAALDEESDAFSRAMDEQVSVDPGRITEHLDAAERALDAAAVSDPTAEQQATIDDRRMLVASFRDLTSALEAMAAGFDGLRVGLGQFENQEFETAAATFESATTSFQRSRGAIEDATADVGRLESDGSDASVSEYRDSLSALGSLTAAGTSLSAGTRLLSLAFDRFFVAATAYDDGDYESAIEPFGTARDYAAEGVTAYAAPDELPADVAGSIVNLQCSAENLRDGADHYQQAAEAGANGNTAQRRDQEEQAAAALDRDCSGAGDLAATVHRAARLAVAR